MALFIVIALTMGIMAGLGIAAVLWGFDSRPTYGDDLAR